MNTQSPNLAPVTEWEAELPRLTTTSQRLVAQCFDSVAPPTIQEIEDPESGDAWIEVCVRVHGEIQKVQEAYRRYTQEWLKLVPADKALTVRLAIRIV